MPDNKNDNDIRCSVCGVPGSSGAFYVYYNGVYICQDCLNKQGIYDAEDIEAMKAESASIGSEPAPENVELMRPAEIKKVLDSYVIGQEKAKRALSAPARQCDVGTAEEQAQRFHDFCVGNSSGINGMCKPTCPCIDCFDKCQCLSKWAQMPYEEEGGAK